MHHQLATSCANEGQRVLYVDNTGVRPLSLVKDRSRAVRKIREVFNSEYGFRIVSERITVLSPILLPHPYNAAAVYINRLIVISKIYNWLAAAEFSRFPVVVYTFLPTPLIYKICKILKPDVLVYYCANDMAGKDPLKAPLKPWENKFYSESDLVFTISAELTKKALKYREDVYEYSPGLDDKFICKQDDSFPEPYDLRHIPYPRICFVGTLAPIDNRFDSELFLEVVKKNKDNNFVMIGPAYGNVSLLESQPNVYFLGQKNHSEIILYLLFSNVAIIPYRVNTYTKSVNTCKLNEYLSVGLPVVSTPLAEIAKVHLANPNLFYIANGPVDFANAICLALFESHSDNRDFFKNLRINYARSNSWSFKYCKIASHVSIILGHKQQNIQHNIHNQRLLLRRVAKARCIGAILALNLIIIFWIAFVSPFFSYLSFVLSARDALIKPRVVIVLTGDGVGSYHNDSFLNRAVDVLNIFKMHKNIKIIVSTARSRLIPEVDVLKDYLVARGVPSENISVLAPNVRTTWDHLRFVRNYLPLEQGAPVVLLSSPLHARRAAAMLRKMSSGDSLVVAPAVVDTPQSPWRWWPSWTEICVTSYELAAYAYAWLQRRI